MKFFLVLSALIAVAVASAEEETADPVETLEEPLQEGTKMEKHPDADAKILFVTSGNARLISGQEAQILVGFINRAQEDLTIDTMDASFRLVGDHNTIVQNLSAIPYNRKLSNGKEASLFYQFHVDNVFSGMPLGFEVSLLYHDDKGVYYREAVFNSTLTVEEPEVAFDFEAFFLYIFLVACVILGGFLLVHCISGNKKSSTVRTETGTKDSDVDYAWLPSTVLNSGSGSRSNSPRQRKNKNA